MTLHQISSSRPLLARKGSAIPAAKRRGGGDEPSAEARPSSAQDVEGEPHRLTVVATESTQPNGADDADTGASEPPPPASLLPFSLHRGRGDTAALLPDEENVAYVDPAILAGSAPDDPPGAAAGVSPLSDEQSIEVPATDDESAAAHPRVVETDDAAVATPTLTAARVPDRAPREQRTTVAPGWLAAGAIAASMVVALAWWTLRDEPLPSDETAGPRAAATAPMEAEKPAAGEDTTVDEGATAPESAAPAAIVPSVDVVRIDPGGGTVIAGRAAPGSELIVLDRGTPLGTVKADAFGEWVFLPTEPLPSGEHEFGLVVKSVQGTVVVPAPRPSPSDPLAEPGGDASEPVPPRPRTPPQERLQELNPAGGEPAPLPPRKPAELPDPSSSTGRTSGAVPQKAADFLVQLASVKTRAGALREWDKLKSRFPELLADTTLSLDEARLGEAGGVVRVRVGPFSARQDAAALCAAFEAVRQDCLVLRPADGRDSDARGGAL